MSNIVDLEELKDIKETSPLKDYKIQDDKILYQHTQRVICSTCQRKLKHYCYYCFKVLDMERSEIPFVKLPCKMDVIKHEAEIDGKSTAIHARILADQDIQIYDWKKIPQYENPERVLMLYPGPNAKKLSEIPRDSFDHLIVIDGTWKQASKIVRLTPILKNVQQVTIEPRKTNFWRFQDISINYLSTIEAIYYLYREYAEAYDLNGKDYDGRFDNLLFYFKYQHDLIQYSYTKGEKKGKDFCWRHRDNYIRDKSESGSKRDASGRYLEEKESEPTEKKVKI